jgi:hypothetical protein
MRDQSASSLRRRVESVRLRLQALSSLRELVALPPESDIEPSQWNAIQPELSSIESRLRHRLDDGAQLHLGHSDHASLTRLNSLLGALELEMSRSYILFDTYMDVLTQRHTREMGGLLKGCDALAWHGLNKDHPALQIIAPPLVYCDRGFAASTMREGIHFPGRVRNPLPLIEIPYSRLKEKVNLTSILHEAGHEAMVRLNLVHILPEALHQALHAAPAHVRDLYALWSSEIGPDFWAFCACGLAETATLKEIVALPPGMVLAVAPADPHPAPLIRVLLSCAWCRHLWGSGIWDRWEAEWRGFYPTDLAPPQGRKMLRDCLQFVPLVAQAMLRIRYRILGGRTIPELFDLDSMHPTKLRVLAAEFPRGLSRLAPPAQLSVFRLMKESGTLGEEALDSLMTKWLLHLGRQARTPNVLEPGKENRKWHRMTRKIPSEPTQRTR